MRYLWVQQLLCRNGRRDNELDGCAWITEDGPDALSGHFILTGVEGRPADVRDSGRHHVVR